MKRSILFGLCITVLMLNVVMPRLLDDASASDVNVVRLRLSEEKSKRLLLQTDIEAMMVKIEKMEAKLKEQPSVDGNSRAIPAAVHFNAKLTAHTDIDAEHIIVFDNVLENVGNWYSSSTGIFRAPESGIYLFTLTILSKGKAQYAHIQLMRNKIEIGRAFAGSEIATWPQSGCVTVASWLSKDDEVYARELPGNTGHLHGDNFCSFSGVFLRADHA